MDTAPTSISLPQALRDKALQKSKAEGLAFSGYIRRLIMKDLGEIPPDRKRKESSTNKLIHGAS